MGRVPGAGFFNGRETAMVFGQLLFEQKRTSLMKYVKIRFPELPTGPKKSARSGDLENRGFGKKIQKIKAKSRFFLFAGVKNGRAVVSEVENAIRVLCWGNFIIAPPAFCGQLVPTMFRSTLLHKFAVGVWSP